MLTLHETILHILQQDQIDEDIDSKTQAKNKAMTLCKKIDELIKEIKNIQIKVLDLDKDVKFIEDTFKVNKKFDFKKIGNDFISAINNLKDNDIYHKRLY